MTIPTLDQVQALQAADRLLLRGAFEGNRTVDTLLEHARKHLRKEGEALAAELLKADTDGAQ